MDIDQKNPWIVSELDPLEEMEFTKVTNSKSKVWAHFTKNAHFQKAKCNDCGKILSITQGSTKSLIGHLRNKHKIVFESSTNKMTENVIHAVNHLPQPKHPKYEVLDNSEIEDVDVKLDENIKRNLDTDQKNPWIVSEVEHFLFFCCPECNFKERSKENFIQHALSHHPNSIDGLAHFMVKSEKSNKTLELVPKHPTKVKKEILDQVNEDDNYYLEQTMEEYPENSYHQPSFQNDASFHANDNSYQNYQNHSIFHNNAISISSVPKTKTVKKKEMNVKCAQCDINFSTKSSLDTHVKAKHLNGEIFQCNQCPQSFSFERYLTLHIEAVHTNGGKKTRCSLCQANFMSKDEVKSHMYAVHRDEKNFQCDQCEMMFGLKIDLNKHKYKVHSEHFQQWKSQQIPSICDLCGKEFAWKAGLREHKKMVHEGRTFNCHICNKGLSTKLRMQKHIQTVHEGRTDHMCSECGRAFTLKEHLNRHIRHIHEGVKRIQKQYPKKKVPKESKPPNHNFKGAHLASAASAYAPPLFLPRPEILEQKDPVGRPFGGVA